jgi:hypothetical protein
MRVPTSVLLLPTMLLLIASTVSWKGAAAQPDEQCNTILRKTSEAIKARSFRPQIVLARQFLTFCVREPSDFAFGLEMLSSALNNDDQHSEALAVANRCLQTHDAGSQFACLYNKASALHALGRWREAQITLEWALNEPAITVFDDASKQNLRRLLAMVNDDIATRRKDRVP